MNICERSLLELTSLRILSNTVIASSYILLRNNALP